MPADVATAAADAPAGAVLYLTRSLRWHCVPPALDALCPAGVLWVRPAAAAGPGPALELAHRLTRGIWADVLAQVATAEANAWAVPMDPRAAARLATLAARLAPVFQWVNALGGAAGLPQGPDDVPAGAGGEPAAHLPTAGDVLRLLPAPPRSPAAGLPAHLIGTGRDLAEPRRYGRAAARAKAKAPAGAPAGVAKGAKGAARRSGAGRKSGAGAGGKKSGAAGREGASPAELVADGE